MNNKHTTPAPAGIPLGDIYYVLFRHKWKIALISALAVAATALLPLVWPRPYESEAKLFIKYVLETKSPAQLGPNDPRVTRPDQRGETIINTELEILSSLDLALEAATNIGPERVLAKLGGGTDPYVAAVAIHNNLLAEAPKNSSVIRLVFKHPDSAVVQPVLNQVIQTYLRRHGEIHRAVGVYDEFLSRETDELRTRLTQTEQDLRQAKTNAQVISLDDSKKMFGEQITKIQEAIFEAEATLAERKATVAQLFRLLPAAPAPATNAVSSTNAAPVPAETLADYKRVCGLLDTLTKQETEFSAQFTSENPRLKAVSQQRADQQKQKQQLEEKYPGLLAAPVGELKTGVPQPGTNPQLDLLAETARIAALESKITVLTNQLNYIKERASALDSAEGSITELQRRKELEEQHYKYFVANLEQARLDEALGPGRVSNIDKIQSPSPPRRDNSKLKKVMAGVCLGGIAVAIALAFLIELYLDRSVRRPVEIESRLGLPLFLTIPFTSRNGHGLGLPTTGQTPLLAEKAESGRQKAEERAAEAERETPDSKPETSDTPSASALQPSAFDTQPSTFPSTAPPAPWDSGHVLRPYWEALRDRLITYFEIKNLTHKPKLVALTGCAPGSGVSTIAAGLAASLSETGDGNVLLVDMKQQGAACQFFKGNLACGLDEALALEKREHALVQDHLYVVTESTNGDALPRILPKRFTHLVPRLKASDYDYIIFDMPSVSQISVTPRLARFMDMVLMVVESGKTDRDVVKSAASMLTNVQANFGIVLNKGRNYVPKRLHQEL